MSVKTETQIMVMRTRDGSLEKNVISLPIENPDGFFGDLELKFEYGRVIRASVPRESLKIEAVNN